MFFNSSNNKYNYSFLTNKLTNLSTIKSCKIPSLSKILFNKKPVLNCYDNITVYKEYNLNSINLAIRIRLKELEPKPKVYIPEPDISISRTRTTIIILEHAVIDPSKMIYILNSPKTEHLLMFLDAYFQIQIIYIESPKGITIFYIVQPEKEDTIFKTPKSGSIQSVYLNEHRIFEAFKDPATFVLDIEFKPLGIEDAFKHVKDNQALCIVWYI